MKLFIKEYKGYIFIYYLGIIITIIYCSMINFIGLSEILYILLFNTFIIGCFIVYKYIVNKKVYDIFENGISNLDESLMDFGKSDLGKNISSLINTQYDLYLRLLQEYKRKYEDHLTFINQWIHQMKTPLSVINLQLQDYEGEAIASDIYQEIDKLDKGLNMAMYFARLEEFQNDFLVEKVNLYEEVMNIVNKEKRLFIKNRILPKVEVDKKVSVYSDKKWIKFVIEQIINNGVKYSRNYGKYLTIRSRIENDKIILDINDEGIGICKKDIKRVFDPFFTGENGRRYGESTGMGLYIVKRVCENLGHEIKISSEIKKGTKISILFSKL